LFWIIKKWNKHKSEKNSKMEPAWAQPPHPHCTVPEVPYLNLGYRTIASNSQSIVALLPWFGISTDNHDPIIKQKFQIQLAKRDLISSGGTIESGETHLTSKLNRFLLLVSLLLCDVCG
jgi:hypothetical protein